MDKHLIHHSAQITPLLAQPARIAELKHEALSLPSLDLNRHQTADLELLLNGAYTPLTGYMTRADHERVVADMRLADGTLWPIPIGLQAPEKAAASLAIGQRVALRDPEGFMMAILTIGEAWTGNPGRVFLSGKVEGVSLPQHHDFTELRRTPDELRQMFARHGWRRVLAYQPEDMLFRAQYDFTLDAARDHDANLLLHPVAGEIPADEAEYFARIHSFRSLLPRYTAASTMLALLPLPAHDGGLRGALLKAIVARNYGCSHVIVENVDEQALAPYRVELGVHLISLPPMVYVAKEDKYLPLPAAQGKAGTAPMLLTEVQRRLDHGEAIPESAAFPEVVAALRRAYPQRAAQGFCIFFTGLSGSGKSTLAKALMVRLLERGGRQVTLLDGDVVRKHLSSELGFSREHRDLNIRRIGYVASEIVKHRGIAICAPIAPYTLTRRDVRAMIEQYGGFFEIHVATPIEVCESRDRKGLYAKARAGLVKEFTGVSDPYEIPTVPELAIDTSDIGVDEAVQRILQKLERDGFLG